MKNIFGYFVGVLLFLVFFPALIVPIVFISYMVWHVKKNLKNPDYITISKTNMLNIKKEPRYCFQNSKNKGRNK